MASEIDRTRQAWKPAGMSPGFSDEDQRTLAVFAPLATDLQGASSPPWLAGKPAPEVLTSENRARLRFAFEGHGDTLVFSVWGAIDRPERRSPPWRVITHSLVFDRPAFLAVSGNPEALFEVPSESRFTDLAPAPWFEVFCREPFEDGPEPATLQTLAVADTQREAAAARRPTQLQRLRERLVERMGTAELLHERLGLCYRALGEAGYEHVVFPESGDGVMRDFVRFVWLSLHLPDRRDTSFITDLRDPRSIRHRLCVLRADRVEDPPPPGWLIFDFDRLPAPSSVSGAQRWWAQGAVWPTPEFARAFAEAEVEGISIIRDHEFDKHYELTAWRREYSAQPNIETAAAALAIEQKWGGTPRQDRVAEYANTFTDALLHHTPGGPTFRSGDRALSSLNGVQSETRLLRAVASAIAEVLFAGDAAAQRWLGLLVVRSVTSETGPWQGDGFWQLLDQRPEVLDTFAAEDPANTAELLEAGWLASRDRPNEEGERASLVFSTVFQANPGQVEPLLRQHLTVRKRTLTWTLQCLESARASGLESGALVRAFVDYALVELEGAGANGPAALSPVEGLVRSCLLQAERDTVERILEAGRPEPHLVSQALQSRMHTLPKEDLGMWIAFLREASYTVQDLMEGGTAEETSRWMLLLGSSAWRQSHGDESAYEQVGSWLLSPRGDEDGKLEAAAWLITERVRSPARMRPAEYGLVEAALSLLTTTGRVSRDMAASLAQLAKSNPGSALPWCDALFGCDEAAWEGRVPNWASEAISEFGQAAVTDVVYGAGSDESLDRALRVAWIEWQHTGKESVTSRLGDVSSHSRAWMIDMIAQCPPLPIYMNLRYALSGIQHLNLQSGKRGPARAKMLKYAPELANTIGPLSRAYLENAEQ